MTIHHRSRIKSPINYADYVTLFGYLGCCCRLESLGLTADETTFAECNADGGYYFFPPQGTPCSLLSCPVGGITGCCCACSYMTTAQKALLDADIYGATFGMREGIGQCQCEDIGGKWTQGPCGLTRPKDFCRKPNGVDVRLPKACCGATLELQTNAAGTQQLVPVAYCEDVCTPKDCSDNTIQGYLATYYNTGRRCFFSNNAGPGVASNNCTLRIGEPDGNSVLGSETRYEESIYPVCNNSNFICWGNNCSYYVNTINNGLFTNPTVNDYNVFQISGAASKLSDFDDIIDDKNVIGNGLFSPFTKNYLWIRARYGRAAFITRDNKVIFTGLNLPGVANGIEYSPDDYNVYPFFKYDKVELGKHFAILRKKSNIGTRADIIGYLLPGITVNNQQLQLSGVQTVHALEESFCISKLNFSTNNIELLCNGYPFSTNTLIKMEGGDFPQSNPENNYSITVVPESISCNGFHCTYRRQKLNYRRDLISEEWVTIGEYKRTRDQYGNILEIPQGREARPLPQPENMFSKGTVIAGHNFDCFMERVSLNPDTDEGYTNLSCYGIWDPSDTNKSISKIVNYNFGNKNEFPQRGGLYADCDYEKCFAVMPSVDYCEQNVLGTCCAQNPCRCYENITRSSCDSIGGSFYDSGDEYTCTDCVDSCGLGCGMTLNHSGSGVYVKWVDVDLSGAATKEDSQGKYIEIVLGYKTVAQPDRIYLLATSYQDDGTIDEKLKYPVSTIYGPNGGPPSASYSGFSPFNSPPHPYLMYGGNNQIPFPAEGIIFDSGCTPQLNWKYQTIKIYETKMNFEFDDPYFKKAKIVVFGGCSTGAEGTIWSIKINCP